MIFFFSLFIPILLIGYTQLEGAILSYLIIESILCVLLVWEYFRIRADLSRAKRAGAPGAHQPSSASVAEGAETEHPRTTFVPLIDLADPEISEAQGDDAAVEEAEPRPLRPSEKRAIREKREEVMRRRTGKSGRR